MEAIEGEVIQAHDLPTAQNGGENAEPTLSAEEHAFTRLVAKGYTYTEAYRKAFPTAKKLSNYTVRSKASRLATKSNILTEIATAKETTARLARLAEDRIEDILTNDSSTTKGNKVADVAMFMYEQANGKATQRIEQQGQYVTVVYDLTGKGEEVPEHIKQQLAQAN